ncbi:MAG: hypothetical protein JW791_01495 [Nanoarchaeota archaeon]|nr:hypothetical protein [Nanoarchaeota archaeon]
MSFEPLEHPEPRSLSEIITDTITSSLRIPNPLEPLYYKDMLKLGNIENIYYIYSSIKSLNNSIQYLFRSYDKDFPIESKKIIFNEYKYFLSSKFKDLNLKENLLSLIDDSWKNYTNMQEIGIGESELFEILVTTPLLNYLTVLSEDQKEKFEKAVMSEPKRCKLRDKSIFLLTLYEFCYIENNYTSNDVFKQFIIDQTYDLITELLESGVMKVNDDPLPEHVSKPLKQE